tara:strand:+ start:1271 stop:1705 length:435 start_codon:yes stop_codon:yes gene_type:complete
MKTLKNLFATLFVSASSIGCADGQMFLSTNTEFYNQPASVSVAYSEENFHKVYFEVNANSCDVDAMNNSFLVFAASEKDDASCFSASAVKVVLNEDTNTITTIYDLQSVSMALASDHPYAAIKVASGERIDLTELFFGIIDNMN